MMAQTDTIVFDIGQVLMKYDWAAVLERLIPDGERRRTVAHAVFLHPAWVEHDKGLLTEDEELSDFISNAPECRAEIALVYEHLGDTVETFPYTIDWIKGLKDRGLRLYALSNWHYHMFEQRREEMMKFLGMMDGYMFSHAVHQNKPSPEIFETFIKRFGVNPEKAVFIDDTDANVRTAKTLGFHTILFESYEAAKGALETLFA